MKEVFRGWWFQTYGDFLFDIKPNDQSFKQVYNKNT